MSMYGAEPIIFAVLLTRLCHQLPLRCMLMASHVYSRFECFTPRLYISSATAAHNNGRIHDCWVSYFLIGLLLLF